MDLNDQHDVRNLVRQAQHGDTVAMNDLLGLLAPWIGRICGSIALEQGEDATQEALMIVLRRLRTLGEPDALRGWERAIVARETVRHAQRAPSTAPLLDLPSRDDVEMATDIRDILMRLSPEHRAVLVLRDAEGLDEASSAGGTTFAWASGLRLPGGRLLRPIVAPVLDRTLRRLEDYVRDGLET